MWWKGGSGSWVVRVVGWLVVCLVGLGWVGLVVWLGWVGLGWVGLVSFGLVWLVGRVLFLTYMPYGFNSPKFLRIFFPL